MFSILSGDVLFWKLIPSPIKKLIELSISLNWVSFEGFVDEMKIRPVAFREVRSLR